MHSNGVDGHDDDQGSVPLPPALTQAVQPRGDDGGTLPLEPFRFMRGIPQNRVDVTEAPEVSVLPEPIFELTLAPELEAVPPVTEEAEAVDDTERVPTSLDQETVQELITHEHELHDLIGPTRDLAERLEQLSHRLRAEDVESLLPSLAKGDRFDTLVAGFLAGYFSAKNA
jgi:hypothetical protein